MSYSILPRNKNSKEYDKAIVKIPEIESTFNIKMSEESFIKDDLSNYFYINIYHHEGELYYEYNFETKLGAAQISVQSPNTESEVFHYCEVVEKVGDLSNIA